MCNLIVDGETICVYPLDDLLNQLGRRWTLLVIAAIGGGTRRFNQLQSELSGISSRTLSERLRELEGLGIVHRQAYAQVPLHVEYSLTDKGRELLGAMLPLLRWASREAEADRAASAPSTPRGRADGAYAVNGST